MARKETDPLLSRIEKECISVIEHLEGTHLVVHYPHEGAQGGKGAKQRLRDKVMTHPYHELVYIARGEADIVLGNSFVMCPTGSFVIIPSLARHSRGTCSHWERPGVEQANSDVLWMIVYPSGARMHISFSRGEGLTNSPSMFLLDRHLITLIELLIDEIHSGDMESNSFMREYLHAIYMRASMNLKRGSVIREDRDSTVSSTMEEVGLMKTSPVDRAVKYIDRNFDRKITLDEIAKAAYVSRAQLTRVFRRERGQTVLEYLTHSRLAMAKSLLPCDDFTLAHIARLSGFGSAAYLSRQFSRYEGKPPRGAARVAEETSE